MTLQNLPSVISWPGVANNISNTPSMGAGNILDAAGEYEAHIICAREAMTTSHVGFRLSGATGSPTADVRIETVDTDGMPSGTLWDTNTNIVTGALSTGWAVHALTAPATIAKGQIFCVKIAYASGTSLATNLLTGGLAVPRGLPYRVLNTGTPTKGAVGGSIFPLVLGSGATTFYHISPYVSLNSVANNAFNNTSSARRGARFQVPFRCRAVGVRHWLNAAVGDFNVAIYSDADAELSSSSTAFDGNQNVVGVTGSLEHYFDNAVILEPATWYRAVLEPTSATNCSIMTFACTSAAYLAAMPGGSNFYYTTFNGSWADSTDTVPIMDILLDQLDDGAGAGGGMQVHPGMNGRIAA